MQVVVLLEFNGDSAARRAALLERVGALALTGQAKLSFVGSERDEGGATVRETVAIGFARAAAVPALLDDWRSRGALPADTPVRILTIEPVWSMEPLPLMFP